MQKLLRLLVVAALTMLSCGHEQQLVSIVVQPSSETFGSATTPVSDDAGLSIQLRALGNYIHPPVTKDITNKVTWASNSPDVAMVSSGGLLAATGLACGNALVSATVTTNTSSGNIPSSGAIVTGNMTATVVCFGGVTLNVDFAGAGSGTVSITPGGARCTATCTTSFASGTSVTLTATANTGAAFGSWAGCDSSSGTTCTITSLTATRTVTVTFN